MLMHDGELRDRVERLLDDTGSLHTVAGLGFTDARAERIAAGWAQLAGGARWHFADLRHGDRSAEARALREASSSNVVVVATVGGEAGLGLSRLVGAILDRQREVDLADGRAPLSRRADQSVVVVCEGCESFEALGRDLRRVPYWEFLP